MIIQIELPIIAPMAQARRHRIGGNTNQATFEKILRAILLENAAFEEYQEQLLDSSKRPFRDVSRFIFTVLELKNIK